MAAERKKIGLIFSYDERWIAGAYYIFNLVHAIKTLQDLDRPLLVVCTNSIHDYDKLVEETQYPYTRLLLLKKKDVISRIKSSLNRRLKSVFGKNLIETRPTSRALEFIFPLTYSPTYHFELIPNRSFWVPDFQEHFYPEFFSAEELQKRKSYQRMLSSSRHNVVFSSNVAFGHYQSLYPDNVSRNHVIQFAVTHKAIENDIEVVKGKYKIEGRYFLCSNQFWMHKNQKIVLQALVEARQKVPDIKVVFTGAAVDSRKPEFYQSIVSFAVEAGISENIYFLGLIPRQEQLCLLKHAHAIIQPSLFEGWSTIIEDAKSMNQFVIASNIDVHKEQLLDYPNYILFDPSDQKMLAADLQTIFLKEVEIKHYDYQARVKSFGENFMSIT